MRMEFVKKLREKAGCENPRQFALKMGIPAHQLYRYEQVDHQKHIDLTILVKMQKAAGLSGAEVWKMIDKEFGGKK